VKSTENLAGYFVYTGPAPAIPDRIYKHPMGISGPIQGYYLGIQAHEPALIYAVNRWNRIATHPFLLDVKSYEKGMCP
jgi:hypothetical protein